MIQFIQVAAEFHELKIAIFGHLGDGNLHPTFHTDECNAEEMEKIEQAMEEIFDYAVELGGTLLLVATIGAIAITHRRPGDPA